MVTSFIAPNWPAPNNITAFTTTRHLHSLNDLNLPCKPRSLQQIHGNDVLADHEYIYQKQADGLYTTQPQVPILIQTADCLPIILCDRQGRQIANLHAGWRGLASGIIEAGCQHFTGPRTDILAWIGPSISAACYQVGSEVREIFINLDSHLKPAFHPHDQAETWLVDLKGIAQYQLQQCGIHSISVSPYCTYKDEHLFHSYRREQGTNGRLFTIIGIDLA